jgi:hypothetical protein
MAQFGHTCKLISNYLGYGSWNESAVSAQSAKQSRRKSSHHYDISDFGLSEKRITQETPFE